MASQSYVAVLEKMRTQNGAESPRCQYYTVVEKCRKKPWRREGEWRNIWKMTSRLQKVLYMAQALQTDWMWPPVKTYDEILNQKVDINFLPEMGVLEWPCTGRIAESLPSFLGIQKLHIFWKAERQGFRMNLNEVYLDQPIVSWSSLSPACFQAQSFPKFRAAFRLQYQKEFSVQSLHNQGFTCRVFYQILKPPLLCRLRPVCAGRCYTVIHPGKLWDTLFSFELPVCKSFIVIWRNIVPSFI